MNPTLNNYFNMIVEAEYLLFCFFSSFHFPHRKHFTIKVIASSIFFIGIAFLISFIDVGNFVISNSITFFIVFMSGLLFLLFCFDYPIQSAIFLSIISYSFRHIIYLLWQFLCYLLSDIFKIATVEFSYWWIIMATIAFIIYIPIGIFLYIRIKEYPSIALPRFRIIISSIFSLFVTVVLNNFSLIYDFSSFNPSLCYVLNIFSFLSTGTILLLLMDNAKEAKLKNEIETINQLRYQEEKQYKMSKESIDLINIKCHDLRHQIRQLKQSGKNISGEELSQIEEAIRIYDTRVKTGNPSLDVILQEKSLICKKNHITFDYIIDGKKFSFMKENDTYSLFGNIIDNAIEACLKLDDPNKRIIRLKVKGVANGVFAIEENSYEGELKIINGLPLSTKGDDNYHGFGIKSISHIVNSYHGTMKLQNENQTFVLSIFFPQQINPSSEEIVSK